MEKVALIGSIGEEYRKAFIAHMAKYGIELPYLKDSKDTGGFKLIYNDRGERTLDVLGVADKIFAEDFPRECLDAKVILLAPILQEIDLEFITFLRANTRATLFLDPQGLIREVGREGRIMERCDRDVAAEFADLVDVIKPNEHESLVLTGIKDPERSTRQLVDWGTKIGIVTLAERGSVIRTSGQYVVIPAYKTLAKDPTGAGDTYAGGFIKKYCENASLRDCGYFATAAASIKIEHIGPDFPLTLDAVAQRVRELNS